MLTTGIEIVGMFVYCQNSDQKNQGFKKLNSIMNRLFIPDEDDDYLEEEEKKEKTIQKSSKYFE